MIVSIPLLAVGMALLWFPRGWMRLGITVRRARRHSRAHDAALDASTLSFRREFRRPRNYYDLMRAATGGLALAGGYGIDAAIRTATPSRAAEGSSAVLVLAAVLLIGLLIQLIRWEHHRLSLAAPVFYLAGLTIALAGPVPALFAWLVVWALSLVMPNVQGFLTVQAVLLAAIGIPLEGLTPRVGIGAALCFVPVLVSLLARRPLIVLSRRSPAPMRDVTV